MKKTILAAATIVAAVALTACSGEKFNITGHITGAADSTLYFEHMTLKGPVTLDSVKLNPGGMFAFSAERPEAPDFYRVRIAQQAINISIDSTETIRIKADHPTMATGYEVTGSDNCQRIKELAVKQIILQQLAMAIEKSGNLTPHQKQDSIISAINRYKSEVTDRYIYMDPRHASSYYALFQTVGRYLIFDPYGNPDDMKAFAAVATCWDAFYPEAERSKNLYNITMTSINNIRAARAQEAEALAAQTVDDNSKITEAGLIDIALPDANGNIRKLTELKGKVVMLDFHLFSLDVSPARIIMMRELYAKYHSRGLEIYQVSLDANEHFWSQQVASLPWICVHDKSGAASTNLAVYNVRGLPDYFLIDRNNNLTTRQAQVEDIEKEIEKLLRK